jgi:hypothetical protein
MLLDMVVDTDESILQFHRMLSVLQRVPSHSLSPRERAGVRGIFARAADTLTLTLSQWERGHESMVNKILWFCTNVVMMGAPMGVVISLRRMPA